MFTLKDKTQVVGSLADFAGQNDTIVTPAGRSSIKAAKVQTIQAVTLLP